MKKFCECLPNLLKIAFGFFLASIYFNGKAIKMSTDTSSVDISRDIFDSRAKFGRLPQFQQNW